MNNRTLIINGSPRPSGDSSFLINELKKYLDGEVVEISAYRSDITPCLDCRKCQKTGKCVLHDDVNQIIEEHFDNVVLATPVYYGTVPGPVLSLMSRFQIYRSPLHTYPNETKKGGLILVAGGTGNADKAEPHMNILFKMLHAQGHFEHRVTSLNTDEIPAKEDQIAIASIPELAKWLNSH